MWFRHQSTSYELNDLICDMTALKCGLLTDYNWNCSLSVRETQRQQLQRGSDRNSYTASDRERSIFFISISNNIVKTISSAELILGRIVCNVEWKRVGLPEMFPTDTNPKEFNGSSSSSWNNPSAFCGLSLIESVIKQPWKEPLTFSEVRRV